MAEKLMESSCTEFVDALASKASVPGGGAAAAYAGALGAALASMVSNFTSGKKRYACYEEDIKRMLAKAGQVQARLVALADEDAAAFYPLSQAYSIPKDDPSRVEVLESATRNACTAPVEMMRQACDVIALLEELYEKGSRLLLSDVGCGALMCRAALEAASLNVFVNTKSLSERMLAESIEAECDGMLAEWGPRAEALANRVMNRLREGE